MKVVMKTLVAVRYLSFLLLICSILYSCKKNGTVGLDVQPETDLISSASKDSSTLLSYVELEDSIKTNAPSLLLLGSYEDPIFGTTTSSFFSQLNILNNSNNIDFTGGVGLANDLVLDSAVLTLQYKASASDARKLYGTSSDPQTIRVYKLTENMSLDSNYYSNRRIPFDSLNYIGSKTFTAYPDSLVKLNGVYAPAHVRIKIDSTFAASILAESGTANLTSNTAFHNFFHGIYVAPLNTQSSGQGAIFYFDPLGERTKFVLYYRRNVSNPTVGDTLNYSFEINSQAAYFNRFQHNYTATPVGAALNNGTSDSAYVYVQSIAGVRTKITMPHLKNWVANGAIAINKAEFVLKVDASTVTTEYTTPANLYLAVADSIAGKFDFPIDFYEIASGYGGVYNAATFEYRFNVTRHVQQVLDGKIKDYGFYLLSGSSAVNAHRVVLFGASKISSKLKLRLTYTNLY